jgi:hypothetical protein
VPAKLNPLASIEQFFDLKNEIDTTLDGTDAASSEAFNLFSTSEKPAKISLEEATYEVPLVNRKRPHEYYFTSMFFPHNDISYGRDDKERISQVNTVVISGSEIIEMSTQPWVSRFTLQMLIVGRKAESPSRNSDPHRVKRGHQKETEAE